MKLLSLLLLALVSVASVYAWDKEDHEIFDLLAALETAEGKGTTFYSFMDVASTATRQQIDKAFKKKTLVWHPDKAKGAAEAVKNADRYSRLSVIADVLRDEAKRKRYDFFYKNGVPKWKGTGYFYSRWRPGFGTVLVFLALLSVAFQLLYQTLNHKRDFARLSGVIDDARKAAAAAGGKGERRKVKIHVGGGVRECSVDADREVYLLDPPHEPYHLTTSSLPAPSFRTTWPAGLYRAVLAKAGLGPKEVEEWVEDEVEEVQEQVKKVAGKAKKAEGKKRR